jgi:hypothetical protein
VSYKNIEDRRAASKRHYEANKHAYLDRNKKYRTSIWEYVKNLKESSPCIDCHVLYPYYVMDFDHLGDKEYDINFLCSTGRIGALKKELTKCELVCANCHRIRTHKRLEASPLSSAD